MLSMTSSAADVVDTIREEQGVPESFALRVFPEDTPDGTQIQLAFTSTPAEGDLVTETEGTKVYVSSELVEPLAEAVIDTEDTEQGEALIVRKA